MCPPLPPPDLIFTLSESSFITLASILSIMEDIIASQSSLNSINFLLGLEENKNQNIKDDNLLNFYLSSITIPNFKYEPSEKTKKTIFIFWFELSVC